MDNNEKRKEAMSWWEALRKTRLMNGTKDRGYYTDKYFGFNNRMYKYLTGDEIQEIYEFKNSK